ncbi:hypothetical protein NDU88_005687 [Pleurodeles waltl]|uniref:Uncharacterized protein n=1 Tax=Pleurodeles waltl TaxID=8319 RepID=A0AAV7MA40_PLEWA|nr:hypothetical protein NDU88_005687 [Pleurodeles waltl]
MWWLLPWLLGFPAAARSAAWTLRLLPPGDVTAAGRLHWRRTRSTSGSGRRRPGRARAAPCTSTPGPCQSLPSAVTLSCSPHHQYRGGIHGGSGSAPVSGAQQSPAEGHRLAAESLLPRTGHRQRSQCHPRIWEVTGGGGAPARYRQPVLLETGSRPEGKAEKPSPSTHRSRQDPAAFTPSAATTGVYTRSRSAPHQCPNPQFTPARDLIAQALGTSRSSPDTRNYCNLPHPVNHLQKEDVLLCFHSFNLLDSKTWARKGEFHRHQLFNQGNYIFSSV